MSNSLLEQNLSLSGINTTRSISRSFKRNLNNDRFIKIPFQVKEKKTNILIKNIFIIIIDFVLVY